MSKGRQTELPDGEYLMLTDERGELDLLSERIIKVPGNESEMARDQFDPTPDLTRALSEARLQRLRELNPDYDRFQIPPTLFEDRRFRFDSSLLRDTSWFRGPGSAIHYDWLADFAQEPENARGRRNLREGMNRIISSTWKNAIERLEPGVHEFFRHTLEFSNYTSYDHFIFRDAEELDIIDFERSDKETGVIWRARREGEGLYRLRAQPRGLALKRERLVHHWVRHIEFRRPFVSRALASLLLPLLPETLDPPRGLRFTPVMLV